MDDSTNQNQENPTNNSSLFNNILLLVLGAVITLTSSFLTTEFISRNEDIKERTQQRLALADNLSKYLAMKYYVVGNFGRARIDDDSSAIRKWEKNYASFDTITVNNTYYFPAHLKILFGDDYEKRYIDSIRSPFDTLELDLTDSPIIQFNKVKLKQYNDLSLVMKRFTVTLYDKAYNK